MQRDGRAAVLLVVALDLSEERLVAGLEPGLEGDHGVVASLHLGGALEPVERLDRLDRVALDRGPDALADGPEQVDQHPAAQEAVHRVLAGRVAAHQPLQGGRLVGGVVVDVHPGMGLEPGEDEIDQLLECPLLPGQSHVARAVGVEGPDGRELPGGVHQAEQVVDAVLERVRVAFEVEEQVARVRLRQDGQPAFGVDGRTRWRDEQLVDRLPQAATLDLDPRLLAHALDAGGARAVERRVEGDRRGGQPGDRVELARDERLSLARGDARHQGEVVVLAPAQGARFGPAADVAMLHGLRIGSRGWIRGRRSVQHRGLEPILRRAVIGHVVVDAQLGGLVRAPAEDDLHQLGANPLQPLELFDVRAHLEHGAGLDVPRQLRIGDLVMERSPDRWAVR